MDKWMQNALDKLDDTDCITKKNLIYGFLGIQKITGDVCIPFDNVINFVINHPSDHLTDGVGEIMWLHRNRNSVKHYTGEDDETGEIRKISVIERYECEEPYCSKCHRIINDIAGNYCAYCGVRLVNANDSCRS